MADDPLNLCPNSKNQVASRGAQACGWERLELAKESDTFREAKGQDQIRRRPSKYLRIPSPQNPADSNPAAHLTISGQCPLPYRLATGGALVEPPEVATRHQRERQDRWISPFCAPLFPGPCYNLRFAGHWLPVSRHYSAMGVRSRHAMSDPRQVCGQGLRSKGGWNLSCYLTCKGDPGIRKARHRGAAPVFGMGWRGP